MPELESKIGSKEPKNPQKLSWWSLKNRLRIPQKAVFLTRDWRVAR